MLYVGSSFREKPRDTLGLLLDRTVCVFYFSASVLWYADTKHLLSTVEFHSLSVLSVWNHPWSPQLGEIPGMVAPWRSTKILIWSWPWQRCVLKTEVPTSYETAERKDQLFIFILQIKKKNERGEIKPSPPPWAGEERKAFAQTFPSPGCSGSEDSQNLPWCLWKSMPWPVPRRLPCRSWLKAWQGAVPDELRGEVLTSWAAIPSLVLGAVDPPTLRSRRSWFIEFGSIIQ